MTRNTHKRFMLQTIPSMTFKRVFLKVMLAGSLLCLLSSTTGCIIHTASDSDKKTSYSLDSINPRTL